MRKGLERVIFTLIPRCSASQGTARAGGARGRDESFGAHFGEFRHLADQRTSFFFDESQAGARLVKIDADKVAQPNLARRQ